MEVIYTLIPGMLLVGLAALAVLFWAARSGQFDDLDGDSQRILMDEERHKDRRRFPDGEEEGEPSATGPPDVPEGTTEADSAKPSRR